MGQSSSAHKITDKDKAILDLKTQRDKLHQYQRKITSITSLEQEAAKTALRNGDKRRALLALRRKKYQESILEKTDKQLLQLEQLVTDVEFALVQKDVFFGLQQGNQVMKEIRKEMGGGIEAVEKLMGDKEDELAFQREVEQMLNGAMSREDEDEVEDELVQLANEQGKNAELQRLPDTPSAQPLPNVPQNAPARVDAGEEVEPQRQAMPA